MSSSHAVGISCKCNKHKCLVMGYGEVPAKIMFIGINGGRLGALQTGVPFTQDKSGILFQRMLGYLGYSKSSEISIAPVLTGVYVTNLVKDAYLNSDGTNRVPTWEEKEDWWDYLKAEIEMVKPKIIIALGRDVATFLAMKCVKYTYLKHPSYYARNGGTSKASLAWDEMLSEYRAVIGHYAETENITKAGN